MVGIQAVQRTYLLDVDDNLGVWIEAFLIDRKAGNASAGTLKYYKAKLAMFVDFCQTRAITNIGQVTPDELRRYLLALAEGHNPGGVHAAFRAVKALLRWFEAEAGPAGWQNPVKRIKSPVVPEELESPVPIEDVKALLATCSQGTAINARDKAIMLALLDTGARAAELLALTVGDVELTSGRVTIRQGKGRKARYSFLGSKSRRALRAWLKARPTSSSDALFVTSSGNTLCYDGLRAMLTRRAERAQVTPPTPHQFRRAFALAFVRAGGNVLELQRLLGHSSLTVTVRYVRFDDDDLRQAHAQRGPVDRLI